MYFIQKSTEKDWIAGQAYIYPLLGSKALEYIVVRFDLPSVFSWQFKYVGFDKHSLIYLL